MTAPRGTEGNLAYMVAFMDYGKDDESRPAAIPGWSEIDYSTGDSAAGHFWMNQVPLNAALFQDYRQTLNMKEATLTTIIAMSITGAARRSRSRPLSARPQRILPRPRFR